MHFIYREIVLISSDDHFQPYCKRIWPGKSLKYVANMSSTIRALYAEVVLLPPLRMATPFKLVSARTIGNLRSQVSSAFGAFKSLK